MTFFSYVNSYLNIIWKWFDYEFHIIDFNFRLWQIALFLFILDLLLSILGFYVKEDYYTSKLNRNKPYQKMHRIEAPNKNPNYYKTFKSKEIENLKRKYN